jgi:hypothetical protein
MEVGTQPYCTRPQLDKYATLLNRNVLVYVKNMRSPFLERGDRDNTPRKIVCSCAIPTLNHLAICAAMSICFESQGNVVHTVQRCTMVLLGSSPKVLGFRQSREEWVDWLPVADISS